MELVIIACYQPHSAYAHVSIIIIYSFCYVEVEDVPPKYESLLGITKMKKAVEKSPNKAGGACKVFEILTGSGNSYIFVLFCVDL